MMHIMIEGLSKWGNKLYWRCAWQMKAVQQTPICPEPKSRKAPLHNI